MWVLMNMNKEDYFLYFSFCRGETEDTLLQTTYNDKALKPGFKVCVFQESDFSLFATPASHMN